MFQTEPDGVNGILKDTPRKSIFRLREGDWSRATFQMIMRSFSIAVAVFVQGWVVYGTIFRGNDESLGQRMVTFKEFIISDSNSGDLKGFSYSDLVGFWLIQDIMSCQLLLQILFHTFTLLERVQSYSKFPSFSSHKWYYSFLLFLLCLHTLVLYIRDILRCNNNYPCAHSYSDFGWEAWVTLVGLPLVSILIGLILNERDSKFYKRHLQFLRLEFDTRLGMHSPR
jgi:hypothetical protein